jgi:hypothetical protein
MRASQSILDRCRRLSKVFKAKFAPPIPKMRMRTRPTSPNWSLSWAAEWRKSLPPPWQGIRAFPVKP